MFIILQIRNPDDETQCSTCPYGSLPNDGHSECIEIPEVYLEPDSGWAIGAMSFSSVGIFITCMVKEYHFKSTAYPSVLSKMLNDSLVCGAGVGRIFTIQ